MKDFAQTVNSTIKKEGYSGSIMIGSDLVSNSSWKTINREKGLPGFFKNIVERLISLGIDTADIENIIKINIQRFLCSS